MIQAMDEMQASRIGRLLSRMTVEEAAGQVLSPRVAAEKPEDLDAISRLLDAVPLGSISLGIGTEAVLQRIRDEVLPGRENPLLVSCNLTNGVGSQVRGATLFPWEQAVGAADNEDWAYVMGEATAREGRELGINWTLAPVVDLNINFRNCMMHCRSYGEQPDHVRRLTTAFIRGVQADGLMAATAKHFPGDGLDARDSHICTLINPLTRGEWDELYGPMWRGAIAEGVMTVMGGHIALPSVDPEPVGGRRWLGPAPATLSRRLQVEMLREELGFEGLIVSDAIPMIGYASHLPWWDYAAATLRAGTDVVLYCRPERDHPALLRALREGRLDEGRLFDAARRVLELKARLGLLGDGDKAVTVSDDERSVYRRTAEAVGDHSICVVRNEGCLPVRLSPGDRVLTVSIQLDQVVRGVTQNLSVVDDELRLRGYKVDTLTNPTGATLNEAAKGYSAVFVNLHIPPRYGTTALSAGPAMTLWSSFWTDHPQVVFTSFGDPYKIYEMPYVPNMINCFSNVPASQRAAVRVWLGEAPARGKSPVRLEGFFELEV